MLQTYLILTASLNHFSGCGHVLDTPVSCITNVAVSVQSREQSGSKTAGTFVRRRTFCPCLRSHDVTCSGRAAHAESRTVVCVRKRSANQSPSFGDECRRSANRAERRAAALASFGFL